MIKLIKPLFNLILVKILAVARYMGKLRSFKQTALLAALLALVYRREQRGFTILEF
jgi:hypothetical protein